MPATFGLVWLALPLRATRVACSPARSAFGALRRGPARAADVQVGGELREARAR